MSSSVIDESIAKFHADPSAAQTAPAVTATLTNGHARLSGGPFNWESDLPPIIGGGNVAPSPTAHLLGAWPAAQWRSSTTRSPRNSASS